MNRSYYFKALRLSLLTVVIGLFASISRAQLTGVKTIPTDYASIAAFVTDLNTQGVGAGGVTLDVPGGYAETAPIGGYAITATGALADQIIITSSGTPKPIITANSALVAGSLNDAIFKIVGGNYITLSNLDLRENGANTITAAASNNMTEWGIAVIYNTTSDGSQNCTLQGNVITLNRTYQNTFAIYANATHALGSPTTSATAITGGGNNGLKIYGNTISNTNIGILVVGPTAATDHNDGVDVGGTSALTGNTITNYGTTGTFSAYANVSGSVNGILVRNAKNVNISYNTVSSSVGGTTAGTLRGIYIQAASNAPTGTFTMTVNNNNISVRSGSATAGMIGALIDGTTTSATSTLNVNNNDFNNSTHTVASSGIISFISNLSALGTMNMTGNTFSNISCNTTGNVFLINNNTTLPTFTISNNSIVGTFAKTGAGGIVYGYYNFGSPTSGTATLTGNNFSGVTVTGATGFYGIRQYTTTSQIEIVQNNTVSNITGGTSAIYGVSHGYGAAGSIVSGNTVFNMNCVGAVYGVQVGDGSAGTVDCYANTVYGLSTTGAATVFGLSVTNALLVKAYGNKIYNLTANNAGASVYGISVASGTTVSVYNNTISGLAAPITSLADGVRGISITSTSTGSSIGVFYNSIYLAATSTGTNFGTSGVFHTVSATATTASLELRNNIIINESVAAGTGLTVAYRRSGTALNNYAMTSNKNLFFAGAPSATNLIFTDGTTPQQTLAGFQGVLAGREINSITGEGFAYGTPGSYFISLTGSNVNFLKPVAAIVTQTESGATNISTPLITTDYASVTRAGNGGYAGAGTAPDMGAFEFEGTTPAPVITLNSVSPATTPQCVTVSRAISVNITTSAGTIVGGNLVYTFNGVPQSAIPLTNSSGSTWTATLPASTPVNAIVAWGITATNSLGISSSYTGTTYSDEPLLGVTASATATNTVVCSGSASNLSAALSRSGTISSGTGTGTSSSPAISPFYHGYGGVKTQYIFRASELTAMGLSAGNITAFSLNVTAVGTAGLNAFSINMGTTAQNAAVTNTAIVSGLTPVYTAATQTLVVGTNTFNITPFNWNGTSNIVISFCYTNNNSGGTSSTVTTDPALAFTSSLAVYADNAIETCLLPAVASGQACMGFSSNATSSVRPRFIFTGNNAPAISSVTWMDGATTVGTGNPLTVNPTVTTTYSANVTSLGCVVSPSPTVTVNVNPLPSTPTATNSAQCGTQTPTASVTSTSGLPTPTFIWYDLAVAGTVQQSDVSTTYLSTVATTTTFYVSELNTVTGCESARVAVTVTVALADGILASASPMTICIGSSVNLTAANTNGTPNQTYTYSWTGVAGSGMTSASGGPQTVTPTMPGSYQYDLTGVDGGCSAVSNVIVTVNPFAATLTPVNVSCNGYNNGSFTLNTSSCGTMPYDYSVDGGGFGAIPTNLAPGSYTVIVRDANMYVTSSISITITQPSTVINAPTTTGVAVCQSVATANVLASGTTNQTVAQSVTLPLNIAAQPIEVNAAPGNVVTSVTVPALPAGATITGVTINVNGLIPNGGEYQTDVRLGLSGMFTNAAAQGTGLTGSGTVAGVPFNYTRTFAPVGFPITGGTLNLLFWDSFNDVTGGDDCTFPLGSNVGSIVINYTQPSPATISWWAAPTGGTSIGAGSPFNTVGTTVLPNTNTPGTYTLYAQGENGGCSGLTRTPVTVTVNAPTSSSTTLSNCTNYTWTNGTTYTASGTYTQTLMNANGCDSVATLNLTILTPSASTTTITNCTSYTWTNGTTYTASGTYNQTLLAQNGCDSIASLNLTIVAPTTSTTTIVQCDSYTWTNGTTYTASGMYTQTLTNSVACDSIATLDLTINNATTGSESVSACESYTWSATGLTYTVSGTQTATILNAAGCDSIVTLNLTINSATAGSESVSACGSYTWSATGLTYTTSGVQTATLLNAAGCDSIATLNLTINAPSTGSQSATACGSYTWSANGATYTTSGTQTATLMNAAGCDSIVTLTLTINAIPTAVATNNGDATLSSSSATGNQWINCATNLPIAGATAQNYAPTTNGSYAVIVTNGSGCSDTSACVTINNVSLHELAQENVNIYPNPATDKVTVTFSSESAKAELLDAQGKLVSVHSLTSGSTIDLVELMFGVYYVRLTTDNGVSIHKVVKQ